MKLLSLLNSVKFDFLLLSYFYICIIHTDPGLVVITEHSRDQLKPSVLYQNRRARMPRPAEISLQIQAGRELDTVTSMFWSESLSNMLVNRMIVLEKLDGLVLTSPHLIFFSLHCSLSWTSLIRKAFRSKNFFLFLAISIKKCHTLFTLWI